MFNNKKDPLVDAVKKIMEQNEKEREALKIVNEAFGVHSKKALPHELHGKYDAMLEEAKKCMAEKLDPVGKEDADIDNDGDVDKSDSYLKNRRKAISKNMKEETILEKAVSIAKIAASMSKKELKKFAGTKEKGLPEKVDESFDALNEEIKNNLLEKLNYVYETYGEQAAQYAYDTLSEEERGILGEDLRDLWNNLQQKTNKYLGIGQTQRTPAMQPATRPGEVPAAARTTDASKAAPATGLGPNTSPPTVPKTKAAPTPAVTQTQPPPAAGSQKTASTSDELSSDRNQVRLSVFKGVQPPGGKIGTIEFPSGRTAPSLHPSLQPVTPVEPRADSKYGDAQKAFNAQKSEMDREKMRGNAPGSLGNSTTAPPPAAQPAATASTTPKTPATSSTTSSLGQELRRVGGNAPATSDTAGGRAKIDAMDKAKPMRNWRDDAFNAGGGA